MIANEGTDVRRLATRVFMTDCLSTLSFKTPPQITTVEMCGDFLAPDILFEASTLEEFEKVASSSNFFNSQTWSLKDLITLFLDTDWAGPGAPCLALLETEHLIMLVFGQLLHLHIPTE
jgi:hypothetical protein